MRICIKNGEVINACGRFLSDVLIEENKIIAVEPSIDSPDAHIIDARGCYLFPGFIDTHTHFDLDLGTTITADNFNTGTVAALLGGTTTVLDFATQSKGGTLLEALNQWHEKANGSSCNYGFHMAITDWNSSVSQEMDVMREKGVTSYKMYMVYPALRVEDGTIYLAMKRAAEIGALIGMHCENWDLLQTLTAEQLALGNTGPTGHPLSRPAAVEAEAISRYLRIAELAKASAYVVHLSTAQGLKEARHARERGQKVYLETCPQYLVLDDERYNDADAAKYVMSPPLRKPPDNKLLWEGLAKNEIDTLGTDHCSFTMAQKSLGIGDFTKIPNGSAGVQVRAMLYFTFGVLSKIVTLEQMAAQLSENAARIFGMYPQKGKIQAGADADIVIWEPNYKQRLTHANLAHACDNSPYEGMDVSGFARDVILGGVIAVQNGALQKRGQGKFVHRGACTTYKY